MSTNTFDNALNFMPTAEGRTGPFRRALGVIGQVFQAVRDGLAASHEYQALRARGVPHDKAVSQVFSKHF